MADDDASLVEDSRVALETTVELLGHALRDSGVREVEVYRRATASLRAARRHDAARVVHRRGRDEGVAVRLVDDAGRTSFAASAGGGKRAVEAALAAMRAAPAVPGHEASWSRELAVTDDEQASLPRLDEVARWLDAAWVSAVAAAREAGLTIDEAWVECGRTVETWAATGGLRLRRERVRTWGVLRARGMRPIAIAARGALQLAEEVWAGRLGEGTVEGVPFRPDTAARPLVLEPEPAALLVSALVRTLHGPAGGRIASPVGPGWVVSDEPRAFEALTGGAFDDAGFPASARLLANGAEAVGRLDGVGAFRRGSFRDPPEPAPSLLVARPPEAIPPDDALRVLGLGIHPLGEAWVLELEGDLVAGDPASRRSFRAFARTTPEILARSLSGGRGPSRLSYRGVKTPALILDPLECAFH